jgi:hypothetical protein
MNKSSLPRSLQLRQIDSSFVPLPHQVLCLILKTLQVQLLQIRPKPMEQTLVENEEQEKV